MTLSPRQIEIVTLVGRDGCQWSTVAIKLGISVKTVETYVGRILQRFPSGKGPRDAMNELYWREVAGRDDSQREGDLPDGDIPD